jgi:hypothetical protein
MSKNFKAQANNYEKPFANQQELRNAIVDKFAKHGNKVRYQVKVTVK